MGAPSEAVHHPYLRVVGPWGVTLPPHLQNRVSDRTYFTSRAEADIGATTQLSPGFTVSSK